jgi:hypothetical protein
MWGRGWTNGREECPGKCLMELIVRKERIVTPDVGKDFKLVKV